MARTRGRTLTHPTCTRKTWLGVLGVLSCIALGAVSFAGLNSSRPRVGTLRVDLTAPSVPSTIGAGPTRTTVTPPDPPAPSDPGPVPSLREEMPTNPPIVTNIPPDPCSNFDLDASVMDTGIDSMQEYQDIVTVTSAVPCRVDGYPSVALSQPQTQTAAIDGGTAGKSNPPMAVAVGPREPASFVIQGPQNVGFGCPAAKLYIGVPGTDPQVLVTVAPAIGDGSWPTCGSLMVSAFEQGNDPGQYLG